MLKLFIVHEMKGLLKTRKVIWALLLFLILFSLFFYIRVEDFQKRLNTYIKDVEQTEKELSEARNYSYLNPRVIRKPKLFSIYHEGETHTYGNVIDLYFFRGVIEAKHMNSEDNSFFNDIPQVDITYLVKFFLSLFILLIAYDCINREKENGTLRIVMTWPFKRNLYLLKKLLGIFSFAGLVFSLPYVLSFIFLLIKYSSLLTPGFITSYLLYWFLIMIYIFTISCAGVLLSILTHKPAKSLVLALFLWVFLTIISPVLWNFARNYFPKAKLDEMGQNYTALHLKISGFDENLPDSVDIAKYGHWNWSGSGTHSVTVFGESRTMKAHREYNRYLMNHLMPIIRQHEDLQTQMSMIRNKYNKSSAYFLFFNPNVLLENVSGIIGGSSVEDHLQFIQDARSVRSALMDQGIRDGWLYSNEYFALYDANVEGDDLPKLGLDFSKLTDWMDFYAFLQSKVGYYKMKIPQMKRYEQRDVRITEVFPKIIPVLAIYVLLISFLLFLLQKKFEQYDVR